MTIPDDRPTFVTAPSPPPSFVRRHPILAGFGVLSGLSLFSALWPASAIVVAVAVAADATGLDRKAWSLTRSVAGRITAAVGDHTRTDPVAPSPAPVAPVRVRRSRQRPGGTCVRRRTAAPRVRRTPRVQAADHPVETRVDGREL